ncbi:hypothetical protein LCGC14_1879530, partial [marine sediment metagenome]
GSDAHIAAYWKISDGGENPTETVTTVGSDEWIGYYLRISGAHGTTPINTYYFTQTSSSSNNHIIPAVTTTIDNTLVLYGLSFDGTDGYTFSASGTGWAEEDESQSGPDQPGDVSGTFGSKALASQGSSESVTVSTDASVSDTAAYFQLAIAPSSGSGNPESNYLRATGFDFSAIPDTAEIKGITVEIDKYASLASSIEDYSVQLRDSTGTKGVDNADPTPWADTDSDTYTSYGGSSDLWGTSWSVSEIKDSAFGVDIVADLTGSDTTAFIDHVQIKVKYDETFSGREWINPDNAKTQNNIDTVASFTATSETTSDMLTLTDFGFGLSPTAQILGIEVGIDREATVSGSITDGYLRLLKAGVPIGDDKASATPWTVGETYVVYGTPTNLWGASWLYSDINDINFGLEFYASYIGSSTTDARIDLMNITIYYYEPPTLQQDTGIVRPDGDISAQWNGTSLPHNTFLSEGIEDPTLPSDMNSYIFTSSFALTPYIVDEFAMSYLDITVTGIVTDITIKVYGNETSTSIDSTVNIYIGGAWLGAIQLDMDTSHGWNTYTLTGLSGLNLDQTDLDNMQVEFNSTRPDSILGDPTYENFDYIQYGDILDLAIGSAHTQFVITGWVNPSSLTSGVSANSIHNVFISKEGNLEIGIDQAGKVEVYLNPSPASATGVYGNATVFVPTGQWTYIAIRYDQGDVDVLIGDTWMYKTSIDTEPWFGGGSMNNGNDFTIGAELTDYTCFNGKLDEISVFNYTLSDTEIELHGGRTPPPSLDFLAEFEELTGPTYDSIHGYAGTLEGNANWANGKDNFGVLFDGDGYKIFEEIYGTYMYATYADI